MTENLTTVMPVPIRHIKGGYIIKSQVVNVVSIQYDKGLMTIEYTADMFGMGVHSQWQQLVPNDNFLENFNV